MTKKQRDRFIRTLCKAVRDEMLLKSKNMPSSWDGIELRWYIADTFAGVVFTDSGKRKGKRYADYRNETYISNL